MSVLWPGPRIWCHVISSSTWWRHQQVTETRLFCRGQMPLIEGSWFKHSRLTFFSGIRLVSELFDPPTYYCMYQMKSFIWFSVAFAVPWIATFRDFIFCVHTQVLMPFQCKYHMAKLCTGDIGNAALELYICNSYTVHHTWIWST